MVQEEVRAASAAKLAGAAEGDWPRVRGTVGRRVVFSRHYPLCSDARN